ncbi:putative orfan [Tupanvirus soda lake]|uniref:Orfan n=2 Tax=Tupanvirus TaxID=2094720 RepID=A0AC62AD79_9VIRU|nr:putative orfan [Tupanvirus soda lake]QKU35652.1 putative orfan [Tupanvirus soda lake]
MNKFVLYCIILLTATVNATRERFTTDNRQVYAYWDTCEGCKCDYYSITAFEHTTNNPNNQVPPFYLYYYHYVTDHCTHAWNTEYVTDYDEQSGLSINRQARNAWISSNNLVDSANNTITIDLTWNSQDSENVGNCNCHNFYIVGSESFNIRSRSNYRYCRVIGELSINGTILTVPSNAYGYIYTNGHKEIYISHL